ncbi:MAG: hypothetical protein MJ224_02065 [archaeon]|nr:hypothetical protein [archaeon]
MITPFILMPMIPDTYDMPPTVYSLLNSYVNYNKEEKPKIKDLAKVGREMVFDFDYPLSSKLSKEEFEVMILNNYMMRRIGQETVTAFKLRLNVKLNSIMPIYNKLFDSLEGWDILNDGEVTERDLEDNRESTSSNNLNTSSSSNTESDRRFSVMPQDEIEDVKDGSYMTEYNLDNNKVSDISNSSGNTTGTDKDKLKEVIKRSPSDKMTIYKTFIESRLSIYNMIFEELDSLFYGLV